MNHGNLIRRLIAAALLVATAGFSLEPPVGLGADGHFPHEATAAAALEVIEGGGRQAHHDTTTATHPFLDHCTHSHATTLTAPLAVMTAAPLEERTLETASSRFASAHLLLPFRPPRA